MVKFLLKRPIAVLMVYLGCIILGVITFTTLPVSLLPDIAIPEITVQVTSDNIAARELENTVVKPIRRQLMQVGKLRDIRSETRDGASLVRLKFDYGTNTDLAFIEVNEKIDAAMGSLPRSVKRPRVIKASATDIPVFYLNLTLKTDSAYANTSEYQFLQLSDFADNVVKRRMEQLPQVAMADITGVMSKCIQILPNNNFMESANLSLSDISEALKANNVNPGSMVIRDGYYEYNIKFSSVLRTINDIRNIYIRKNSRIYQLKDLAKIEVIKQPETGLSTINGKRAVTLGIIKQADETMKSLKKSMQQTLAQLEATYPQIEFTINRNQTELLDYTISNLKQNLSLGFILVFLVALLFLGDGKSPFVIGLSMLSALIIAFVFFYLFHQSLNIISLSGMILAIGMMIDSSIIVTDIITQYREKGNSVIEACIKGTNEVITPILSSTFTTIAVFVPLVFLSGIAGAIFFDQAFAVSIGLLVSYVTGITLLPVLYYLFYKNSQLNEQKHHFLAKSKAIADKISFTNYDRGFRFVFKYKFLILIFLLFTIPLCAWLFMVMPKAGMPYIDRVETVASIEWNENIHLKANNNRVDNLLKAVANNVTENAAYVGQQQYLLDKESSVSPSEAQIYLKTKNSEQLAHLQKQASNWIKKHYPKASIAFAPPKNIFEKIFDTDEPDLVTELYVRNKQLIVEPQTIRALRNNIGEKTNYRAEPLAFDEQLVITVNREKLLQYGVAYQEIFSVLKTAFKANNIATLRSYQQYLPIVLSGKQQSLLAILDNTLITANGITTAKEQQKNERIQVPLKSLVSVRKGEDLKTIVSGKNGEYIPMAYYNIENPETLMNTTKQMLNGDKMWDVQFSGSFFGSEKMLTELVVVLLVSVLLMYFILASQFESFLQPLIVLVELPIDIAFALLLLWATGNTLNLMSAIGIVVTCGIIINDSILKIDMMNELRKQGASLMDAIHTAGTKRLRAIIMTSLTTILAMVPLLFSHDMGSELQKPLAIAMIGTMLIGTLVSLYVIPLVYWLIYNTLLSRKLKVKNDGKAEAPIS